MNITDIYNKHNDENSSVELLIVIGLPGSGKTTYIHSLKNYIPISDFMAAKLSNIKKIRENLLDNKNVAIDDVAFCSKTYRIGFLKTLDQILTDIKAKIRIVFFENNKDGCLINIEKREGDNSRQKRFLNENASSYKIPEGFEILPIYTHIEDIINNAAAAETEEEV